MAKLPVVIVALMASWAMADPASASTAYVTFNGSGVAGSLTLTYGPGTDAKYPNAFEVTGIGGTFSDTNNGLNLANAPVGSLIAINHATPDSTNLLAPSDFSHFAVASGLPAENHGNLTYDNLLYPNGSPQTASDYAGQGGFLDIYGLLFNIDNGVVVDLWSNGVGATGTADYGIAVANPSIVLDRVDGGVMAALAVPEPGSLWLLGSGLLGFIAWRRNASKAS